MALICRTGSPDIHTTRCRLAWRGDFAELHARTGLLSLDLDDWLLVLTNRPTCMRPVAKAFAKMMASGFAESPACGGWLVATDGTDALVEFVQVGTSVAIYPATQSETRVIAHHLEVRQAIVNFLREFRG